MLLLLKIHHSKHLYKKENNVHVIIANGPPFCGKDTLTKHLLEYFKDAVWMRFKNVLYQETWKDLFVNDTKEEISLDEWIEICNDVVLKDSHLHWNLERDEIMRWKECPEVYGNTLYCKTPRQHLIYKSENELKVKYGLGGVAVITSGYIKDIEDYKNKIIIFSDGGFNIEINTMCEELDITRKDMTVIRIDGILDEVTGELCNFDNDSREYIDDPDCSIFNDKTDNFIKIIDEVVIPLILKRMSK